MDEEGYRLQARMIKALAHATRLQMLALLRDGDRCACEFGPLLGLRQANVSQHLGVLRRAQLVDTRRDGLRIMYSLSDERIAAVVGALAQIARDRFVEAAAALEEVA
ncbi:MAG TPA: metalloregulator ArsR/SmtB family transcription factor [Anaerolineae bacterium]|nr:metalloregulator ArsR/SmtB family transcription factor [Anaerolineae bacterium]